MELKKHRRWKLMVAILSLSLLTVMAGAAVAPALDIIKEHFSDKSVTTLQLIISLPAVFIAVTNLFFQKLCRIFNARTLTLIGLGLYVVFGCAAGLCNNIYLILVFRALLGIGTGIMMPMSTGLITYFFTKDKQAMLMGYSSSMNMLGGVIATLIAGWFAMISWRLSFLVYLMGILSIIPVALWMPKEKIIQEGNKSKGKNIFKEYYSYIICMFLVMLNFFIYPSNFALECGINGAIKPALIPALMAFMDISGFAGGLLFPKLIKSIKGKTKLVAPLMFLTGYVFLQFVSGFAGTVIGSFLVGAANGIGIPFIMSSASQKAGKLAATTVIPALSFALYLSQFLAPAIVALLKTIPFVSTSYIAAVILSAILLLWTVIFIGGNKK